MPGLTIGDAPAAPNPGTPKEFMVPNGTGGVMVDPAKEQEHKEKEGAQKQETVEKTERPTWLPEKFKSPEDLAKAYSELERKQGSAAPAENKGAEATETALADAGFDIDAVVNEWRTSGGALSEQTVTALKAKGLNPTIIGGYVAGQDAAAAQTRADFVKIAGDDATLDAILKWAPTNLPATEAAAYNAAIQRNDTATAKMLFEAIAARYVAANGRDPSLVGGSNVPGAGSEPTFASWAEVTAAMSDPRYKNDPAYQKKVQARLLHAKL